MTERIPLMKPFMPPKEEFDLCLRRIWNSGRLTNNGPIHAEFEDALKEYLSVKNISLVVNGTMALFFALRNLRLQGEVITTPFTSVATLQAILMNGLKPVYADINQDTLNIDPALIEKHITGKTCALLPVHVFGEPCDVDGIKKVADRHGLKVIYDAAHCFGVRLNGKSLLDYGNVSVVSLHATKVMNSIEGGIIVCGDPVAKDHIDILKNVSQEKGQGILTEGFNGKMNEFQAAFGLVQLRYIKDLILQRKNIADKYHKLLAGIPGIRIFKARSGAEYNYSYMPVIIDRKEFGADRDAVADYLDKCGITTRKYFHPLISDLPGQKETCCGEVPVAREMSQGILCLPLFPGLEISQVEYIVDSIDKFYKSL